MAAVHVGVGHDDDLAVAAFFQVEIVADAAAQGADDRANFLVAEHLHEVGFFDVEELTAQGEDRLDIGIAALLGEPPAESPSTRNNLGVFVASCCGSRRACRAGCRLRGCSCGGSVRGPCGPLRGPRRRAFLSRKSPWLPWDFLRSKRRAFRSPPDCTNDSTSVFSSLSLVWLSNCGSGSFTLMMATSPSRTSSPLGRVSLSQPGCFGVAIDGAGEGGLEAAQVRAAVVVVDVVGEGEDAFRCSRRCTACATSTISRLPGLPS